MLKIAAILLLSTAGQAISGDGIRIIDGDTLSLSGTTFRLHGIDAPEYGQKCATPSGDTWACGKESTALLLSLTDRREVTCDNRGIDDYGRVIGVCKTGNMDINAKMVSIGAAWAFRKYSSDYVLIEDAAKEKKIGIWQAQTQTPWDYRSSKWVVAAQKAPEGCPIKGNISKTGKIYHSPWSPWYSKTKVSIEKGERWFCDEAEAVAAGWREPSWKEKQDD